MLLFGKIILWTFLDAYLHTNSTISVMESLIPLLWQREFLEFLLQFYHPYIMLLQQFPRLGKVKDEVYNGTEYQTVAWFIREGYCILGSSDSLKARIIHHHQLISTGCPLGAEHHTRLFVSMHVLIGLMESEEYGILSFRDTAVSASQRRPRIVKFCVQMPETENTSWL